MDNIFILFMGFLALVIAITIHEFSHAFTANKLGDPTPRLMGRLTLNPLAHLDPLGTIMLFIARFGWGKPVEFDPLNLKNPRRDAAIISLAGPVSNLLLSAFLALIVRIFLLPPILDALLMVTISINVMLAVFNLLPIHPLDGFKIVGGLLSENQAREWYTLEKYGFLILILLILPFSGSGSTLSLILNPLINIVLRVLLGPVATYY